MLHILSASLGLKTALAGLCPTPGGRPNGAGPPRISRLYPASLDLSLPASWILTGNANPPRLPARNPRRIRRHRLTRCARRAAHRSGERISPLVSRHAPIEMTRKGLRSMCSQSRLWMTAGLTASSMALIVGLSSLAGCNPHKDQLRPENLFGRIGRQTGQIIEPKKCMLRVAILNRPFLDAAINETVWKVADEQAIAPEVRRSLELNGLRIGQITGELPTELDAILNAPPPHKVEPASF